MRNYFLLLTALFFTSIFANAQRSNCSVSPYPNTIRQADGSKITLYAFGNEAIHYLETPDGFTVLKNSNDIYEYAINGVDGSLTLSGIKANDETTVYAKNGLQRHLRYSPQQTAVLMQYFEKLQEPVYDKKSANVFPPTGNRKIIVVLMEFPDLRSSVTKANFELLFNQPNYEGTGSFKDYYLKTSYGKLNITVDVYGWYMAPNGYKYYKNATTQLLSRAAFCADSAGVDFSQYDSDNDGYVDAIMVMHAGIGGEEPTAPNAGDYIWSFRSTWGNSPVYNHSKRFWAYAMFPEKRFYTASMVGIGVMTHEFGHILDLPDLYATNYNNTGGGPEGVGNFANMAGGPWLNNERTPCMHDAFCKILLDWLTPTVINASGTYTIAKSAVDSNFVFRVNTSRSNEYFLLENKQREGQDYYIPSSGLAIWHVNTAMAGKLSTTGNNANNDTSNQGLGILQADGKRHLELGVNRGDAGDLFPGSTSNKNATPFTNPNTNLYYKVGGIHQSSGLYITGITNNPDHSVTFKLGSIASASYTPSSADGCAPLTVSFNNSSVFVNSFKWDLGDGTMSTDKNQNHTYTNPGNYDVWLRAFDSAGTIVDSSKQTIQVYASPVAHISYSRIANDISFINTSTGASSYYWKFGTYTSSQRVPATLNLKDLQSTGIIHFSMIATNTNGCSDTAGMNIDIWATSVQETQAKNIKINLYPNPIEQNSILSFTTDRAEKVNVEIYNILGEKIVVIEDQELRAGLHEYEISKDMLTSKGVYLIRINSASGSGVVRLLNQ